MRFMLKISTSIDFSDKLGVRTAISRFQSIVVNGAVFV